MKRTCLFAGAWLCVWLLGGAYAADARIWFRRDPRPQELIAVRDESLALQNKISDDFCLVRFDALSRKKLNGKEKRIYNNFLDEYILEPEKFFVGKQCEYDATIHQMVSVRPEFFYFADAHAHYALLPARNFIATLAKEFYGKFRAEFKITDTFRARKEQNVLVRQKKTKADGSTHERESSHLSGAAFDISRLGLSVEQNRWLEEKLMTSMKEEKIVAVEELYNNAFHIFVYPDWESK